MTSDLFSSSAQTIALPGTNEQCTLHYFPYFLTATESDQLFAQLLENTPWQQSRIRIAGRTLPIPRLNAWYGDSGANYGYSGTRLPLNNWTPELMQLRQRVEAAANHHFNSALLNLYRDGNDSVAWHSDDEPELGLEPVIASVSLGAERRFQLKQKQGKERFELQLSSGALLVMAGATQILWQHQVPKERGAVRQRVNITFREVLQG
ncbi:alpha-ketoglutarate-dependent dioxygenase AlkB [Porticoccus sp. W117]|uniref:alpha-ketoglutarate-dependent dioxygenase AlkB family protein n=1 Tax=Porticoccus sp. W117 TaxID=3054777 RepID=UPI0025967CE8|nr:alpha-ketoglutarate-dependent dioxygenase AlkB [Porticoccus sp. W117]MDM3872125.1 alpha-ketoglutarate-dependent dioxygenase AlkB [Porticoccus sp. W117]